MALSPTPLNPGAKRFGVKKNHDYVWIPDSEAEPGIADSAGLVPTEAEVNAGTLITGHLSALTGLTASDTYADTPDLVSDVTGKVWDGATLADSSLSFYASDDEVDALDFFTSGDAGYLIHAPYGLDNEKTAIVWAVEVGSVLPVPAISGASLVNVALAPRRMEKVTLPASA